MELKLYVESKSSRNIRCGWLMLASGGLGILVDRPGTARIKIRKNFETRIFYYFTMPILLQTSNSLNIILFWYIEILQILTCASFNCLNTEEPQKNKAETTWYFNIKPIYCQWSQWRNEIQVRDHAQYLFTVQCIRPTQQCTEFYSF